MTFEERIKIISKEVLTLEDLMALMCISKTSAGFLMRSIKAKSDRLGISTVCHLQDYLDAFNLPPDRYIIDQEWRSYLRELAKIEKEKGGQANA